MNYEFLLVEIENHVAKITFNRPQVLNAFDAQTINELDHLLDLIAADETIYCVIFNGSEGNFAAGADITNMVAMKPKEAYEFSFSKTFSKIEDLPQPTIAAVAGYALGAGCELALACDFRIAGRSAKFGLPEIKLGIMPGAGGTQRLPRLIGIARAKELIMLGNNIDAESALAYGLVNKVVADEVLLDEAMNLAKKIAAGPPEALKAAKKVINYGVDLDLKAGIELEAISWSNLFSTQDQKEGMQAFLEKRKPNFKGN
ncbi:MAG: enoyl-CoA hydratase/isomerase family protein [Syntrophomonadaceae bacterium]|nr:enoyl-CoA hydratase/isomerase family protein [Syntrophomonadaceae bacterium]